MCSVTIKLGLGLKYLFCKSPTNIKLFTAQGSVGRLFWLIVTTLDKPFKGTV